MENKLDCEIVRDLLPSYTDGLTAAATNRAVEAHLAGCADCAAACQRMRAPEPPVAVAPQVDYLKKVRSSSTRRSLLLTLALLLLSLGLLGFRYFYVGVPADPADLACRITATGGQMELRGTLLSSGLGVTRVSFSDSNGMVQFRVYTAPKTFFNSGDFSAEYTTPVPITQVRSDDLILWESGVDISVRTAQLFAAANQFVGDMPANDLVAALLGVAEQFGPYRSELHTEAEPYGWTLLLDTPLSAAQQDATQQDMLATSCLMLAVIGNLSYVTWDYATESGRAQYTLTAEQAGELAGQEIKHCGKSAAALQELAQRLGYPWAAPSAAADFTLYVG